MEYPLIPGRFFFNDGRPYVMTLTEESPYLTRHWHDYVEIAYVVEGEGLHYIGDKIIRVSQGDLYIIPVGESHVFQPLELTGKSPLRIMNCLLNDEWLVHDKPLFLREARGYLDEDGACRRLLEQMLLEQPFFVSAEQGLWLQLMELLTDRLGGDEDRHALDKGEVPIHQALHFMGHKVMDAWSLPDISRLVALSTRHFQRLFKAMTGKSYTEMLQEIRIQHSCGMLVYTQWSVQSIAERVGIQDMQYFYRLFRSHCGMTPAAFRRSYFRGEFI